MEKSRLLQLFKVCSEPNCGAMIDPADVKVSEFGAAVKVTAMCLQNHPQEWSSSSSVGEGHKKTYTINIVMAAFTLFCGLNITQVKV